MYESILTRTIRKDGSIAFEGNVANCDMTNLANIVCRINSGKKWNDGTPITIDDILATYSFFKSGSVNKVIPPLLKNITVSGSGDSLRFTSEIADVATTEILLLPIISTSDIQKILDKTFTPATAKTSGAYAYQPTTDLTGADTRMTIQKRADYTPLDGSARYIDRYVVSFFPDTESLIKKENNLNIIIPNESTTGAISGLKALSVELPEYIAASMNTEKA